MSVAVPVLRQVTVSIGVNYIGAIPSSLQVSCTGLSPSAVLKVLINGVQASTLSLDVTGTGGATYLPNIVTTGLLAALGTGAAQFTFSVDNQAGVVAGYGAITGGTVVFVEVTY